MSRIGNSFTLKNLLSEMILYKTPNIEINMNHILNAIKELKEPKIFYLETTEGYYELKIFDITEVNFSFEFNKIVGKNLFR